MKRNIVLLPGLVLLALVAVSSVPAQAQEPPAPAHGEAGAQAAAGPTGAPNEEHQNRWEKIATRKSAVFTLFAVAFAESSFFPVPPDALLIPMGLLAVGEQKARVFMYAGVCSVASVLGGILGYVIGYWLYKSIGVRIVRFYKLEKGFDRVSKLYRRYAGWAVGIAGFTPLPYKLFTIAAGAVRPPVNFRVFIIASAISRSARFFLVATLIYFYGPPIRTFLKGNLGLFMIAFVVLLVLGFWVIKKFVHHHEKKMAAEEAQAAADAGDGATDAIEE